MRDIFRRVRVNVLLTAILTVIIGIILIVSPGTAVRTVFTLLGWILIISGVMSLLTAILSGNQPVAQGDLVLGLIQLVAGIVVLMKPGFLMSLCGIVIGFVMVIHGVHGIQGAREGRALGYEYKIPLAVGIVTLVLGVIVMINPFATTLTLLRWAGIFLVIDGVSDALVVLYRGHRVI